MFCMSPMGRWLTTIKLTDYEQLLISSGFDDVEFMVRVVFFSYAV